MRRTDPIIEEERFEFDEAPRYVFTVTRRTFLQGVGAGLLITAMMKPGLTGVAFAQERREASRLHIGDDGIVTVFSGKVEVGQGSRTEIALATAEELRVPVDRVQVVLADTDLVPDDGGTYGSQTTPRTIPRVREAAAATRDILIVSACAQWGLDREGVTISDGIILHPSGKSMTLAELVSADGSIDGPIEIGSEGHVTNVADWSVMGKAAQKFNAAAIATGLHQYPSDIRREGMVYGAILRPPTYGATLKSLDTSVAEAMDGVSIVRDGDFVGVTAPTRFAARKAVEALAADWNTVGTDASSDGFEEYLVAHATEGSGRSRSREQNTGDVDGAMTSAKTVVRDRYAIPFIQHAPMETRSACAEWDGSRMTVWTATQRPFDVRDEIAQSLGLRSTQVRLIVPDSGGGFGGKHRGDAAIEAARLAYEVRKPVSLQWTREEEFTWAYFRPAGVMDMAAAIDSDGAVTAFEHVIYNAGGSGLECPYTFPAIRTKSQACASPLREGSYRGLAATANHFAREAFIDRVALAAGLDPLAFRLRYIGEERMKNVVTAATEKFGWSSPATDSHYGLACGAEKGSFVATCAEVKVDTAAKTFTIVRLCTAFECGAIIHPQNLQAQVDGSVVMGLGPVLGEAITFANGIVTNPRFKNYAVPRFDTVPVMETVLVNRPDLPSVGAGETPIVAVAPAIANAIFAATGTGPTRLPLTVA